MLAALGFLTTLGPATRPSHRAFAWFPVVGAALGGVVGLVWWGAGEVWPPLVAAALVVAADVLLTGGLHADGLADSADGLLVPASRERRLDIMRDPHAGVFGMVAVVVILMLRWSALTAMSPEPVLLVGLWAASRSAMAAVPAIVPYARDEGLGTGFLDGTPTLLPALALVPATVLAVVARGMAGGVAVLVLVAGLAAVVALARRRIGGYTGDVLGAALLVGETAGLVVAAA